jgi:DNA-directed RNA polymerase subunit RPC12/RpoP
MGAQLRKLSCALWGHHVDNHVFRQSDTNHRQCRCGADYLGEDLSVTRVRHTLSCFLGKHHYEKLADRDGCHEYVCTQCGHPLLFEAAHDPYAAFATFKKKVRYLCGLFGHRAKHVATRHGYEEYACFCGHSFLKLAGGTSTFAFSATVDKDVAPRRVIRHPAICVIAGHFIHFLATRGGYAEYVCINCGHPFCFAEGLRAGGPEVLPSPQVLKPSGPDLYSRHEAGHLGHVHGSEVHQPVPAVFGAAHRI